MKASVLRLTRLDFDNIRKENNGVFDTYTIHKIVYSLFPKENAEDDENGEKRNFLFAYQGGDFNEKRILIFSKENPIEAKYGKIETRDVPEDFLNQDYYGFQVQMNPVVCNYNTEKKKNRSVAIRGKANLLDWFSKKSESFGFEIEENSLSVSDTNVLKFKKKDKNVVFGKAVFTGRLKVTNRELFKKSVEEGIGKGKAFGFGLLQVVPLNK